MELEIFNIQSEQQQQRDDDLRSPLVSAVRANCLRTANLLFVEGTNLGHQNRQKTNAQNACNKLPVYSISTRPVEVDTCTHWVPIFLIAACVITFPLDSLFHFVLTLCGGFCYILRWRPNTLPYRHLLQKMAGAKTLAMHSGK